MSIFSMIIFKIYEEDREITPHQSLHYKHYTSHNSVGAFRIPFLVLFLAVSIFGGAAGVEGHVRFPFCRRLDAIFIFFLS